MGKRIRRWFTTRVERSDDQGRKLIKELEQVWVRWANERKTPTRFAMAILIYDALLRGDPSRLMKEFPWLRSTTAGYAPAPIEKIEVKSVAIPVAVMDANLEDVYDSFLGDF